MLLTKSSPVPAGRRACVSRVTGETAITVALVLDGRGQSELATGSVFSTTC